MGNHNENDNNNVPKENKNNISKGQTSDNDKDKKDKDEKPEDININNNQSLEIKNDENINIIKIEKIRRGRKINLDKTQKIHSKYDKDNIMIKLKLNFFRYIFDLIHKQLINKDIRLLKISHRAIIDLAYKGNERLLKMKISDILYEQEISPKYRINMKNHNKNLIDKIYEEKKERNVIKIFELTFEELFIIFRRKLNNSEDLKKLEEIKNKIKGLDLLENDNYQDVEYYIKNYAGRCREKEYIEEFKDVCLNYEKYFNRKKNKKTHY